MPAKPITAPKSTGGNTDIGPIMEMVQQLQFAMTNKADLSLIDELRGKIDDKPNRNEIVARNEMMKLFDQYEKTINDNTRRVAELENKLRLVDKELQELF